MENSSNFIKVTKPVAIWNKSLKIDGKGIFKGLSKAIIELSAGNYSSSLKEIVDFSTSFGLAKTIEEKSFLLICASLNNALVSLFNEYSNTFKNINTYDKIEIINKFDNELNSVELTIDQKIFTNPSSLKYIKKFIKILDNWLQEQNVENLARENIIGAFPEYFNNSFYSELSYNKTKYQEIHEYLFNNPYDKFIDTTIKIRNYQAKFNKLMFEPILRQSSGMNLDDIYIDQYIQIYKNCLNQKSDIDTTFYLSTSRKNELTRATKKNSEKLRREAKKQILRKEFFEIPKKENTKIHEFITQFFNKSQTTNLLSRNAKIILILGYPGQGKTSFCQKYFYNHTHHNPDENIYFIQLRNMSNISELIINPIDQLKKYVEFQIGIDINVYEFVKSTLLIDGLDEIYMKENLNNQDIDKFVKELELLSRNCEELKIILTSRYGYIDIQKLKPEYFLILRFSGLSQEQQISWLNIYTKFNPTTSLNENKIKEINSKTNLTHIKELINQPILLQIIATANFDINATSNRSKIYNELFTSLIERNWSKNGQTENLEGINMNILRKYISSIALKIFHSGNEFILKKELEDIPETKLFLKNLKIDSFKNSLKFVMIAFYFKEIQINSNEIEENENYAIEFLHKSLQEYLSAELIWVTFKELTNKYDDLSYKISNIDMFMNSFYNILSPRVITNEIENYLIEIIKNDTETDKFELSERMIYFFSDLLNKGFISEYNYKSSNFPLHKINAVFHSFWTVLSNLGCKKNFLNYETKELFSIYLLTLQSTEKKTINLSYQDLVGLNLAGIYLKNAQLIMTDFSNSDLTGADLTNANCENALFIETILNRVSLNKTNLTNANLSQADILGSNFGNTITNNAIFNQVNLSGTRFIETSQITSMANKDGLVYKTFTAE